MSHSEQEVAVATKVFGHPFLVPTKDISYLFVNCGHNFASPKPKWLTTVSKVQTLWSSTTIEQLKLAPIEH